MIGSWETFLVTWNNLTTYNNFQIVSWAMNSAIYSVGGVLLSLFAFFAKFWTHNGQTLGMQAWGLRIQNADGSAIDLWQALLRFVVAIGSWLFAGLGFLWLLWDKQGRTWHDIYSDTRVVRIPKKTK